MASQPPPFEPGPLKAKSHSSTRTSTTLLQSEPILAIPIQMQIDTSAPASKNKTSNGKSTNSPRSVPGTQSHQGHRMNTTLLVFRSGQAPPRNGLSSCHHAPRLTCTSRLWLIGVLLQTKRMRTRGSPSRQRHGINMTARNHNRPCGPSSRQESSRKSKAKKPKRKRKEKKGHITSKKRARDDADKEDPSVPDSRTVVDSE